MKNEAVYFVGRVLVIKKHLWRRYKEKYHIITHRGWRGSLMVKKINT
jgi:hypothetical protein